MCETCLQDIVVSVAYQNDCCYVRELSELTFSSLHKISMVGNYTQITKKKHTAVKIGGLGVCLGRVLAQGNTVLEIGEQVRRCLAAKGHWYKSE